MGDAQMRRAFDIFQWIVSTALLALFAWGVLQRPPPPERDTTRWRNWDGFCAISYSGVPRESYDRYISKEGLDEHFAALKAAGFHTITPDDAADFLAGRAPLPENALLILFEGGRKDSFIAATPLLRKHGFVATYGVPTGLTERWGSFYVRSGDIGKLADMDHWTIASMGHEAYGTVPVDAAGKKKGFLTHQKWLGDRTEDQHEVRTRITNDYARAAALIAREAARPAAAYIAPYQFGGPWRAADEPALRANNVGIENHARIAFMRNEGAYNGPGTDPRSLTRLNAGGQISPDELVKKLKASLPRPLPVERITDTDRTWHTIGPARATEGSVVASITGRAWLQGTAGWTDLEVATRVERRTTNVLGAIYVRYTSPESYLRVVIGSDLVRVQERIGARMQTLAQQPPADPARTEHELHIRAKGNRAWITVDGELIGGNPVPLTFATARGAIGLTSDHGNTTLTNFSARPIHALHALAKDFAHIPTNLHDSVVAYLPAWFRAGVRTRNLAAETRTDALLAGARGIETIPVVLDATNVTGEAAAALGRMIAASLDTPSTRLLIRTVALRGANLETATLLEERGYKILFILAPAEAAELARTKPAALHNRSVLLECGRSEGEHRAAVRALLRVTSTDRVIVCGALPGTLPPGLGTAQLFLPPEPSL